MNNLPAASNEDFLADCTTNVFSLAEIPGLRWKKYTSSCDSSDCTLNDPILSAYAVARNADILCVWRRVTQPFLTLEDSTPLFDCPKELVIFWYGDEPDLNDFPGPALRELETGCADDGLSTETLDLFFKAIHSVIEKNLLTGDFVRLGKWFTKPQTDDTISPNGSALAFSFSIFVHGESSVVASVDIREKNTVRLLKKKDLNKSCAQAGNETKVLLAPYGLNAYLTGHSIPDNDARSSKFLGEWKKFFQVNDLPTTSTNDDTNSKIDGLPKVVEVTLGDVKMLYPSSLVLIPVVCTKAQSSFNGQSVNKNNNIDVGDLQDAPLKLVDQVWNRLKKKEEPSPPSKQLWEIKENSFPSGCKCSSNSNVTRVKSNTGSSNPFNASYLYANNTNSNNKAKRETPTTTVINFHQRVQKVEKTQGRVTPPSLTGRITPLSNSYKISSVHLLGSNDKPGSVNSNSQASSVEKQPVSSVKKETTKYTSIVSTATSSPSLQTPTDSKYSNKHPPFGRLKCKNSVYELPKTLEQLRPHLPDNPIEVRSRADSLYEGSDPSSVKQEENVLSPCSVFGDDENEVKPDGILHGRVKRSNEEISTSDDVFKKKIKTEPLDTTVPAKRGPGRPRGRRNSTLNQNQVNSPISIHGSVSEEDQLLSPNTRRQSARQMLRKRESPTPSPKPGSPPQNGPGRSRKQRKGTNQGGKTPNTPKSENVVFNFSNSNSQNSQKPVSPPTPYISKLSTSSSLTHTRDLMATEDDLKLLFDEEEDEDMGVTPSIKKIANSLPSSHNSVFSPHQLDDTNHLINSMAPTTGACLTNQDLAQMFPTPPSLEPPNQTMSPTPSDHHHLHTTVTNAAVSLLSPDVHPSISIHDTETLEINLISKSPITSYLPTFQISLMEQIPMPEDYQPIPLPSHKFKINKEQLAKYVPTWDTTQTPPVLSRRPSGNRVGSTTASSNNVATTENTSSKYTTTSKDSTINKLSLPLVTPAISSIQRQISEIQTPGFSPLTVTIQDHKSLFLNLRLTDSFINWKNRRLVYNASTTFSVQEKTYKVFKIYQNISWRTPQVDICNHPLFPEDEPMVHTLGSCMRPVSEVETAKFPFTTDLIEILLKTFSSSLSVNYFHLLLSHYYQKQSSSDQHIKRISLLQTKLLSDLKPSLESAIQKPIRKTIFDKPKVDGPLSFNKLNDSLNANGLSSAQSSSAVLFTYDNDILSVSPEAMRNWQRLSLEPFGGPHNVEYIVILPDTDFVVNGMKLFFKELNGLYESLNLGTHKPIVKDIREGFLRISQKSVPQNVKENVTVDEWFDQSDSNIMAKMKVVAQFCKRTVGPYVASIFEYQRNFKKFSNPMSPGTTTGSGTGLTSLSSSGSLTVNLEESVVNAEREHQPTIVLYMVDPFHVEAQLENYPSVWSYIGLMRCFLEVRNDLNDCFKENLLFQVIPLEQILNLNSKTSNISGAYNPQLKELALNIYTRCRPKPLSFMNKIDKCMTGFGVSHVRENLVRRRKVEGILPGPIFLPPYILSPSPKYLNHEIKSVNTAKEVLFSEKDKNILFCAYCLSADKQWLCVSCTDKLGEINETTLIRITYPKKKKNKGLIWSIALRKLWEFLIGVLSFSISSWRIVLCKYGDMGQSEFRELKEITKKNMEMIVPAAQSNSRPISPLTDNCNSCSNDESKEGKSLYKSITVCTIQRDQHIRFTQMNGVRNTNQINSRIYVMPARKCSRVKSTPQSNSMLSTIGVNSDLLGGESTSLLANSFDEDNDASFLPMLPSPGDATSIFQASPQSEIAKILSPQNMTSPQTLANPSMSSLSPFQPIQHKQMYMTTPSKSTTSQEGDANDCLAIGYLLSISDRNEGGSKNRVPTIIKSELHLHMTSSESSTHYHPLDTNNHLEVVKYFLEDFERLSWLNVNPSSGKRQSSFPVHVNTIISCREILKTLTG